MCGIIAYIGHRAVTDILVKGLRRMEYRGYDSAGVGVIDVSSGSPEMKVVKKVGKVVNLASALENSSIESTLGIAHTRWATHGPPSDENSHPHTNMGSNLAVVHNGIIENYSALKTDLMERGYQFQSETDTEVLAHLVEDIRKADESMSLTDAVGIAAQQLRGTFGLCFIDQSKPDTLVGCRSGSPLILGVGEGEYFLASDASAIVEYTTSVVYLEEGDIVTITRQGYNICSLNPGHSRGESTGSVQNRSRNTSRLSFVDGDMDGQNFESMMEGLDLDQIAADVGLMGVVEGEELAVAAASETPRTQTLKRRMRARVRKVHQLEMKLEQIEKAGYKHFMLKEVMEQPRVLKDCMRGRLDAVNGTVRLGGLEQVMDRLVNARRFIICACGTSWHSALVGEYLIEELARVPVEVEYASEFRYRRPILLPDDVVIVMSQSGETADTLAAVREAKQQGCLSLGLVNVVGSTIARETDAGVYLHVGPEIGVASTKAFTGQVLVLSMLAVLLGKNRGELSEERVAQCCRELAAIPESIDRVLKSQMGAVQEISKTFRYASNFLYLGRGFNFPVALEGALKLKEISYIHAEGYPAAEMKHGPLALIDRFMPVVMIAPSSDPTYEKSIANMQEVMARGGSVVMITNEDNAELDDSAEFVLRVPYAPEWLMPLLTVIPMQLLSYYIADMRGCNVDQPRNLAKSVTVE